MIRTWVGRLVPVLLLAAIGPVAARAQAPSAGIDGSAALPTATYATEQVTFLSDGLKIRSLRGRPPGDGPHPAVIVTHGSMRPEIAAAGPWSYFVKGSLSDRLAASGFVVLLVARRGHRGSEGTTLTYTHESSRDPRLSPTAIAMSIELEVRDIVAAIEYLHALPFVDRARIGVSGHSLGGLIGVMAASRDSRLRAVLSLAGGYRIDRGADRVDHAWQVVDTEWRRFATAFTGTTMILWSKNDALLTVATGEELAGRLRKAGKPVELKVYPPFKDNGHYLFTDPAGFARWVPDALSFFTASLSSSLPAR